MQEDHVTKEVSHTTGLLEEDSPNVPIKLHKILSQIGQLRLRMIEHRKESHQLCSEMAHLEKTVEKYAVKIAKEKVKNTSEKQKRKPSGFASPTTVTPELCEFMGKPEGSLISRTETSKFLTNYISENRLYEPTNKSVILPDSKLVQLIGDVTEKELTYFSIQKFINRHFIKPTKESTISSMTANS
jgi:chromatin remodeling complex protein RSC6